MGKRYKYIIKYSMYLFCIYYYEVSLTVLGFFFIKLLLPNGNLRMTEKKDTNSSPVYYITHNLIIFLNERNKIIIKYIK